MAGVTSNARAVDVRRIALMFLVHLRLWMARAVRARKRRIVQRIRMTRRANAVGFAVIHVPEIVGKCRPQPTCCGVASRAGSWNDAYCSGIGGEVIRYGPAERCSALPLCRVAAIAIRRGHSGTGVAEVARHSGMRAGQGKAGCAVVKDRAQPRGRGVARRAGGWIACRDVVRYRPAEGRGALPLCGVATITIGG
jgi:hypothetical protein